MFSCLRRSDRRESDGMGHVWLHHLYSKENNKVYGNTEGQKLRCFL